MPAPDIANNTNQEFPVSEHQDEIELIAETVNRVLDQRLAKRIATARKIAAGTSIIAMVAAILASAVRIGYEHGQIEVRHKLAYREGRIMLDITGHTDAACWVRNQGWIGTGPDDIFITNGKWKGCRLIDVPTPKNLGGIFIIGNSVMGFSKSH